MMMRKCRNACDCDQKAFCAEKFFRTRRLFRLLAYLHLHFNSLSLVMMMLMVILTKNLLLNSANVVRVVMQETWLESGQAAM